jgi:hypothetical protein
VKVVTVKGQESTIEVPFSSFHVGRLHMHKCTEGVSHPEIFPDWA